MLKTINEFLNRILDPVFLTRFRLKECLESTLVPLAVDGVRCLDVGCGDRPYEYLFKQGCYIGIDVKDSGRPLNMKKPDHFYDGEEFPFQSNSFDMVISTQVLEHVPSPLSMLKEMARVCNHGGMVVISLPFVYQEHEEPFDYFRFTRFGVAELFISAGLKVETMKRDCGAVEAIATLCTVYIVHNLVPDLRGFGRLYSIFICLPLQLCAMLIAKILPDKGQLYLNLVVSARKI